MTARGGVPGRLVRAIGIRRRGIAAIALLLVAYAGPAHAEPRQAGATLAPAPALAASSILGSASRGLLVRVDRPLARPADLRAFDESQPHFPIRGRHGYGEAEARFGGGRGHQGQDVFAACGTPLVAVRGGNVQVRDYHGRAGNYLVIDGAGTTFDYVYAHLRDPARVDGGRARVHRAADRLRRTHRTRDRVPSALRDVVRARLVRRRRAPRPAPPAPRLGPSRLTAPPRASAGSGPATSPRRASSQRAASSATGAR